MAKFFIKKKGNREFDSAFLEEESKQLNPWPYSVVSKIKLYGVFTLLFGFFLLYISRLLGSI